jgi:hypothetical protein
MHLETETGTYAIDKGFLKFATLPASQSETVYNVQVPDDVLEELLKFYDKYMALDPRVRDELERFIEPENSRVINIIRDFNKLPKKMLIGLLTIAQDWKIISLTNIICYILAKEIQ